MHNRRIESDQATVPTASTSSSVSYTHDSSTSVEVETTHSFDASSNSSKFEFDKPSNANICSNEDIISKQLNQMVLFDDSDEHWFLSTSQKNGKKKKAIN